MYKEHGATAYIGSCCCDVKFHVCNFMGCIKQGSYESVEVYEQDGEGPRHLVCEPIEEKCEATVRFGVCQKVGKIL